MSSTQVLTCRVRVDRLSCQTSTADGLHYDVFHVRSESGCIPMSDFCCVFGQGQQEQRELQRECLHLLRVVYSQVFFKRDSCLRGMIAGELEGSSVLRGTVPTQGLLSDMRQARTFENNLTEQRTMAKACLMTSLGNRRPSCRSRSRLWCMKMRTLVGLMWRRWR